VIRPSNIAIHFEPEHLPKPFPITDLNDRLRKPWTPQEIMFGRVFDASHLPKETAGKMTRGSWVCLAQHIQLWDWDVFLEVPPYKGLIPLCKPQIPVSEDPECPPTSWSLRILHPRRRAFIRNPQVRVIQETP